MEDATILLNDVHKIFSQDEAEKLVVILNSDNEDGWTYTAENNPNPDGPKTAIIKIFDQDGEFVKLL